MAASWKRYDGNRKCDWDRNVRSNRSYNIPVLGLALSCGMLFTKTLPSIKVVPPGILSVNTTAVASVFPVFVKVVV